MLAQDQQDEQCSLIALVGPSEDLSDNDWNPSSDIFVMNSDGSHLHPLTETKYDERYPAWSPDGKYIVFSSNKDRKGDPGYGDYGIPSYSLYIMNSDGSYRHRLTHFEDSNNDLQPSWSPNGKSIVYYAETREFRWIEKMSSDGQEHHSLYIGDGFEPSWSPNSEEIIYTKGEYGGSQIYTMDADGSNIRSLTSAKKYNQSAVFSPDGQWIAFESTRDQSDNYENLPFDIYVMREDGSDVKRLTFDGGFSPSWSPDGTQIVYDTSKGIAIINRDGSESKIILPSQNYEYSSPVWSPNLCVHTT
ncbi:MAG: PD40 domain-containing protein [Anaerolineae bacterium]|nr:PD40 domain-containing protein [Anaerolineae bacterium]